MTKRNVMHDAVRYALFASTGALALNMGVVSAQEDDAEVKETEEVLVTGSRITRSTLNTYFAGDNRHLCGRYENSG